jgi:hypothetical protein
LLAQIMPEHFRRMAWLMGPLSENERKTFVRLLTKVLARAGEEPALSSPQAVLASAAVSSGTPGSSR